MPWLSLLTDLRILLGIALIVTAGYAAVQRLQKEQCRAEFAQFRAEVETAAAKAKVKNAQEAARQAQNAQEALDGLQIRLNAISAASERLRRTNAGSRPVSALSSAATSLSTCAGDAGKPDAVARRMDHIEGAINKVLEFGDKEIAKYVELWKLQQANSATQ